MSKTKCCNLPFIGDNHSPYETKNGKVVCRNCGSEYQAKSIIEYELLLGEAQNRIEELENTISWNLLQAKKTHGETVETIKKLESQNKKLVECVEGLLDALSGDSGVVYESDSGWGVSYYDGCDLSDIVEKPISAARKTLKEIKK